MPIYEYRCQACGHELEALQRISEDPLTDCPECNQAQLKKLVSAAGFRLKGGGWYETDFKTGSKRNVLDAGDAKADKSDAKSDTKTDTKKAADSTSKSDKASGGNNKQASSAA